MKVEWPEVAVAFVLPSGVATMPVTGGAVTCRLILGHVDDPHTGLLEEVAQDKWPVPWVSERARTTALLEIKGRADLQAERVKELTKHIENTPWYEE